MNKLVYDKKLGTGSINNITLTVAPTFSFEYEYILVTGDTGVYTTNISVDFPNVELSPAQVSEVTTFITTKVTANNEAEVAAKEKTDAEAATALSVKEAKEAQAVKDLQAATVAKELLDKENQATEAERVRVQSLWDSEPTKTDRESRAYLASTDWYVIRKIERNIEIPADIVALRLAAVNAIQNPVVEWTDL